MLAAIDSLLAAADFALVLDGAGPNLISQCACKSLVFTVHVLHFAHSDISLTGNKSLRLIGRENTPNTLG